MDKPAEGLAFARIERDDGIMPYPVLIVGDVVVKSYMNGYEDYSEMEKINAAHEADVAKRVKEASERCVAWVRLHHGALEASYLEDHVRAQGVTHG